MSKGNQTRQHIVTMAAALFNQRGFAGTSLGALMQATGLEKGGIYRHFPSKQAIALEAFDHAWRSASDLRTRELDFIPDCVDRLKKFVQNFVERTPAVPGGCPMFNTAVDSDDGNRALRLSARKALRGWLDYLRSTLEMGMERGEVRRDIDARRVSDVILACLEGGLIISRLQKDPGTLLGIQAYLESYLEAEVRMPLASRKVRLRPEAR